MCNFVTILGYLTKYASRNVKATECRYITNVDTHIANSISDVDNKQCMHLRIVGPVLSCSGNF